MLRYLIKFQKKELLVEFMKNVPKIYIGLGTDAFENTVLYGIKESLLLGFPEVMCEIIKAIKMIPQIVNVCK